MNKFWIFTSVAEKVNRFRNIWPFLRTNNFDLFSKHFFAHLGWVNWTNKLTQSEGVFICASIFVIKNGTSKASLRRKLTLNQFCSIFRDWRGHSLAQNRQTWQPPTDKPTTDKIFSESIRFRSDSFRGIHKGRPRSGGRGVSQIWTNWDKGRGVLAKKDVLFSKKWVTFKFRGKGKFAIW